MTSREEFRKYRSAAHKQEINIHVGTYSDVPRNFVMDGFSKKLALQGVGTQLRSLGGVLSYYSAIHKPACRAIPAFPRTITVERKNPLSSQSVKNVPAGDRQSNTIYSAIHKADGLMAPPFHDLTGTIPSFHHSNPEAVNGGIASGGGSNQQLFWEWPVTKELMAL